MSISVQAVSVDLFTSSLTNLSALLEKGLAHATARKFDPGVLLNSRLCPDMFPLTRQVQIACDLVKNSVARLAGLEPPRFEDNEKTVEELRGRIARTIDYIKGIPERFKGVEFLLDALEKYPDDQRFHYLLATLYRNTGNTAGAEHELNIYEVAEKMRELRHKYVRHSFVYVQ